MKQQDSDHLAKLKRRLVLHAQDVYTIGSCGDRNPLFHGITCVYSNLIEVEHYTKISLLSDTDMLV